MKNFIEKEQFPYKSVLGWEYDSGDYHAALQKAMGGMLPPGLKLPGM